MSEKQERIRPFDNGIHLSGWQASNCQRCTKFDVELTPVCDIDYALLDAYMFDGTVSPEIAERMGAVGHNKYVWQCGEVEWTEEWKAEVIQRQGDRT